MAEKNYQEDLSNIVSMGELETSKIDTYRTIAER